jgi:hypothetical protein
MPPKLPSLPNLAVLVKPDKLQTVYAEVESFVGGYSRRLPEQASTDLTRELRSLTTRFGPPVEAALRALLCDQGSLRNTVEKSLEGGAKSALALVVPLLVAQFALAPTVALLVATLVIKALATHGQKKLCAELSQPAVDPLLPALPATPPAKTVKPASVARPKRNALAKAKSKTKKPAMRSKTKSKSKPR